MKTSKKILGVVLAIIMIFNVFAVGSFAAFADGDTGVKLMITPTATSYKAGDTITLTVSAQTLAEVGKLNCAGQYEFAYNSEYVEPYSTSTDLLDHGFVPAESQTTGFDNSMSQVIFSDTLVDNYMSQVNEAGAEAYGWDSIIEFCVNANDCYVDCTTAPADLFTINFKLVKDAPEGTVIGFNPDGYEWYMSYIVDENYGGVYGIAGSDMGYSFENNYEFGTCTVSTVAEEDDIVYHVKDQIQWADKAANTVNLGVVAGFDVEDIDIAFDGNGTSTNVTAVGATVVINGVEETKTERFVYEMNDGASYYFRTVIAGIPADSTDEIVVTPFVTYTVNGESKTEYCDAVTVTAASLAANLPA